MKSRVLWLLLQIQDRVRRSNFGEELGRDPGLRKAFNREGRKGGAKVAEGSGSGLFPFFLEHVKYTGMGQVVNLQFYAAARLVHSAS